ncbi:condensation domain-containing protein [Sphaerisporangium aureirubrum]|uniref:Condensation domain-containing protein n=1 Tax=Sphaerisporangium aureirubrum TaxID=1544736 RepID=A0ABW1NDK1_9ACTN
MTVDETERWPAGLPAHRRELAARLLAARRRPAGDAVPVVPRDGGLLECSPEQRRLWLAAQADRHSATPNVTMGLGLAGPLDLAALARALTALTDRHETLRTVFVNSGGEPRQMVLARAEAPFTVVDLTGDPDGERTAREMALAAGSERFDLATGPLLRLTVYRLSPSEHRLLLVLHHIACDGGSLGVVAGDLATLYGGGAPPPPPAVRYADYAAWAAGRARPLAERRLPFWRERLGGDPPVCARFPAEQAEARETRRTGTVSLPVGAALMDALRGGSATPFVTVFAAFLVLLNRVRAETGGGAGPGITVGTAAAGRSRREFEPIVGCFANMVPVHVRVDGALGFRALVETTRQELGAALANEIPFDTLVSGLGGRRRPGVHPVFQMAFIQRDDPRPPDDWPGLLAFEWGQEVDDTAYDLTLTMTPHHAGHDLILTHRLDRVSRRAAAALATAFETLLTALSISPDVPVDDLALPDLDGLGGAPAAVEGPARPAAEVVVDEALAAEAGRIWCEVLGVPRAEPDANLFELGGDSLAVTRIAALVKERLGVEIPAWAVFEAPTVTGLAVALAVSRGRPAARD